jgi:hypothetical protein
MKFALDKLEQEVEESTFLEGEILYADLTNSNIKEVDKNIWLSSIAGNEVELLVTGKKIKNYTCECDTYHHDGICGHIVALILAVRKKKANEKPEPVKQTRSYRSPKRLTVMGILDSIEERALRDFILEYSRKDQQFTTALKARFASSVHHLDLEEKYAQLLQTLLRSNQSANHSISRNGAKKIYDALQTLMDQADNDLAEKNFMEVFELVKNIIGQVAPMIGRFLAHKNDILSSLERAYLLVLKLSNEGIPPALKDNISTFLIEILKGRNFTFPKIEFVYLNLILKYYQSDELAEAFIPETSRMYRNRELETSMFLYHAALLEKRKDKHDFQLLLDRTDKRPWLILSLIESAYDWNLYGLVKKFSKHALKIKQPNGVLERIEEFLLQTAVKEGKTKEQLSFAQSRLLQTLNLNYFDIFKKAEPSEKQIESLIKDLKKLPESERKYTVLSAIFEKEARIDELFELMVETKDVDLLSRFIVPMFQVDARRTKEASWIILNHFLETHVGRPPSVKTRNLLRHLYLNDLEKLARFLLGQIRTKYGDRNSIEEELGLFR